MTRCLAAVTATVLKSMATKRADIARANHRPGPPRPQPRSTSNESGDSRNDATAWPRTHHEHELNG